MTAATDEKTAPDPPAEPIAEKEGWSWKIMLAIWGPSILILIIGFSIAWVFVEPAPDNRLVIATGSKTGNYYATALEYQKFFEKQGIELEIVETAGTVENYKLLLEENDIHLAIVQGGARPPEMSSERFESLASLYLEPLWIFQRADNEIERLRDLTDLRVNVGLPGSGTEALMMRLLAANTLVGDLSNGSADAKVELFHESTTDAIEKLKSEELDAVCVVTAPSNPLISEMVRDPEIKIVPFPLNKTYRLLFPFLSAVSFEQGILDLNTTEPPDTIPLIAPAANLICTPELHDAFVHLLMQAAKKSHSKGNLLVEPGTFPNLDYVEYEVHTDARDFIESGHSFLYRVFPFWVASFLNRTKILLLPLITLALPLFKVAPPVYRWQIRSRIYRWYALLREIDQALLQNPTPETRQKHVEMLDEIARELSEIKVPLSYMEEFYNLHLHIDLIRRRVVEGMTKSTKNSVDTSGE